jgi:hypothetical protein
LKLGTSNFICSSSELCFSIATSDRLDTAPIQATGRLIRW